MLSRLSPLLRTVSSNSPLAAETMPARVFPSAMAAHSATVSFSNANTSKYPLSLPVPPPFRPPTSLLCRGSSLFGPAVLSCKEERRQLWSVARGFGKVFASWRQYRQGRRKPVAAKKKKSKERELELSVNICIEEQLPDDPEILGIAEMLRLDVPMAMKLAFDGLKDSTYKTRDPSISDVGAFNTVELSVLLCNDDFIRKLNKDWRGEDHPTDVLSMSQHVPELQLPILLFGDIVISVETAARQAEERGHSLHDEIRILLVHGLLHLLGFDHEISDEAEEEMEKEEEFLLKSLEWTGKGLIRSACDAGSDENAPTNYPDDRKKEGRLRFYRPKYNFIFCDMDGTLLNSKSLISAATGKALKEAMSRGVKVIIATGKTRPAVIRLLRTVDLAGKDGVISEFSPGVFLQGLLVYGRQGREIYRRNLDSNICREAFLYSQKHQVPLIAFSEDRCLTLFEHPLVDSLHTVYSEPKAEIIPSVEQMLATAEIQVIYHIQVCPFLVLVNDPLTVIANIDLLNQFLLNSQWLVVMVLSLSLSSISCHNEA
ncbi:OLC1v1029129C1 [Oldenlandia corymbosa var. corymbosa]|uniref:OLC1v1029129C1 n=1 Tax=Oldenlandia corymbosa var. corymbosa TaxID=529605 RepID=A0AAV1CEP4_OLDCO|nr:OLC1v1029129C1 [Oldenlandia corymbosa var. corymbosa]